MHTNTHIDMTLPLHASMPSAHVCSASESSSSPHFLNQSAPRAQQLGFAEFAVVPHLTHVTPTGVVAMVVGRGESIEWVDIENRRCYTKSQPLTY